MRWGMFAWRYRTLLRMISHKNLTSEVGQNHDLDFGVAQLRHLRSQCQFPWLLANVLDPALGEDVPIANCERTWMLTSSNGLKVGVIGLGEREW
jgi:2',3'-cyclic-nucleotide 2'-phosphodiesterase (5'-nucleotidase family)